MRYTAFADGFEVRESATWDNIIRYTIQMCRKYKGHVVNVKCKRGHMSESFIWCEISNDIIPA